MGILGIVLGVFGVVVTWYFARKQKQKGHVNIEVQINSATLDPNIKHDAVFKNPNANKTIELDIYIRSKHKLPIDLQSPIIAVPKFYKLAKPSILVRNWPIVDNIQLELQGLSLPQTLPPGEELKARSTGLAIAQKLQGRGYSGDQIIMFGIFDGNKNAYYSKPFELNVENWLDDCGHLLIGFL